MKHLITGIVLASFYLMYPPVSKHYLPLPDAPMTKWVYWPDTPFPSEAACDDFYRRRNLAITLRERLDPWGMLQILIMNNWTDKTFAKWLDSGVCVDSRANLKDYPHGPPSSPREPARAPRPGSDLLDIPNFNISHGEGSTISKPNDHTKAQVPNSPE